MNKKEKEELEYAKIFVRYINSKFGFDYSASLSSLGSIKIPRIYPDVDVVLFSSLRNFKPLFLQLVLNVEFVERFGKRNTKLFSEEKPEISIRKKEEKYKNQNKDISNIIILVQGYLPLNEAKDFVGHVKYTSSKFKGIYFIIPGGICRSSKGTIELDKDLVYPLKQAFGSS